MSDFSFKQTKETDYILDLIFERGELKKEDGLRTAVLISLFTDARCERSEIPIQHKSQRGFWGDCLFGEKTGSKLWLLERSKLTNETLIKAKEYAMLSLNWLLIDGIANEVKVNSSFMDKKLVLEIQILKKNNDYESITINNLWD